MTDHAKTRDPGPVECPVCDGKGTVGTGECGLCAGHGTVSAKLRKMLPISPADCAHDRVLFVQGMTDGYGASHHVSLCQDCGQFWVSAKKAGVSIEVAFELSTSEQLEAAGRHARFLRPPDVPR